MTSAGKENGNNHNEMDSNGGTGQQQGTVEVLIKGKYYRASAAVMNGHLGIALDEEQPDGPLSTRAEAGHVPEGKRVVKVGFMHFHVNNQRK